MFITVSELNTFTKCRALWNYSSPNRMNLQPKGPPKGWSTFGVAIHEALAAHYSGSGDPLEVFEANCNGNVVLDTRGSEGLFTGLFLLQAFLRWAKTVDLGLEIIDVEQRHTIPLPNGHFFRFKYDALAREKGNGRYWLMEHKTRSQLPTSFEWLEIDPQMVAYQLATEIALKVPITGTLYTFIRKKEPTTPSLLKSGKLSTAKTIVTTREVYEAAILAEQGRLKVEDYAAMLAHIERQEGANFFRRTSVKSGRKQRVKMHRTLQTMTHIMDTCPDAELYLNPSEFNCRFCPFESICLLRQKGLPYQSELERKYEQAPTRD